METAGRRAVFGVCVFLAAAVWIVFGQTLHFGFTSFDDDVYVYENSEIVRGISWRGIAWLFTHTVSFNWHPLTMLSHMLDCQFYGLHAGGHHLTNVLLHTATTVLLFLVLRDMTGALWRSAFVAAVFAVHPLHVESVAWVAERKDVLSGLFFVLTIWAYVRYVRQSSWRRYLAVLFLFALGLMSKPMLVTLPFVLLLLDYWPLRRFDQDHFSIPWRLIREKIPLLALSAAFCAVTFFTQEGARNTILPLSQRLPNVLASYVIYLEQLFWPSKLAVFYPYPEHGLTPGEMIAAALVLAFISATAWIVRRKYPCLLVGWLWYLGMLLPVIGLVQVGAQAHADRYTYLPQIGLCLMIAWLVADLSARLRHRFFALAGLSMIVLASLIFCARAQTSFWKDSETLWLHTLDCTVNNDVAHDNLGVTLLKKGRVDEAIVHFQQALAIEPDSAQAHNNLAISLIQKGRADEAFVQFQKAVAINPDFADAHANLGRYFFQKGRLDEAIAEYETAVRIRPDHADTRNDLSYALIQKREADAAIVQAREALQIRPDFAQAHGNLGLALVQKGQVDEGTVELQKALAIQPNLVEAQNDLAQVAWIMATSPNPSARNGIKAVELSRQTDQLSGGKNPMMAATLAAAYAEDGRFSEAVTTAERAVQLADALTNAAMSADFQAQLKLYQAGSPFRVAGVSR